MKREVLLLVIMNARRIVNVCRYAFLLAGGFGVLFLTSCQMWAPAGGPRGEDLHDQPDGIIRISEGDLAFAHALAHFSRGYLYELNQEYAAALEQYQQALHYDPDHQDTYLRVALNLMRRNRTMEAIEVLRELTHRKPDEAQPLVWLGMAYRHQNNVEAAVTTYQAALKRDPNDSAVYLQLVDILIQQGQEQEAIVLLIRGAEAADEPGDLYRVLGEMYMRQAGLSIDLSDAQRYTSLAIETLKTAASLNPQDSTILNTLGDLYLRNRQFEQAVGIFERMATLLPDDVAAKERLALAYEWADQLEEAVRVLQEMAILRPTNARIFFALGGLYERLDDIDKAVVNYQLAARLDRPDPAAYLKLAVLQMEDRPEEAVAALRGGLTFLPDNPRLLEMLGYVLFNKQEYAKAIASFRRAETEWTLVDQDAMTPNFHLYLSLSYYFNNQPEQATDTLWKAMERNEDALEAFAHFVFDDDDEDRIAQAIPVFTRLLEMNPEQTRLYLLLAYLHSFQKEYAEALNAFARAKERATGTGNEDDILDHRFYFWYAAAHEREDMHEQAEKLFYKCLELDPGNAEAYNYLAYMWAEQGINLDKAEEYVLIALEQKPDSGAFIDTLGWIHYQQGRYEEAYAEIKRAAEIIPDDPTILDHLGDIYLKLEQPDKALGKWKRSYLIDPDNEEVEQKLAESGVDPALLIAEAAGQNEENRLDADKQRAQPETKPITEALPDEEPEDKPLAEPENECGIESPAIENDQPNRVPSGNR